MLCMHVNLYRRLYYPFSAEQTIHLAKNCRKQCMVVKTENWSFIYLLKQHTYSDSFFFFEFFFLLLSILSISISKLSFDRTSSNLSTCFGICFSSALGGLMLVLLLRNALTRNASFRNGGSIVENLTFFFFFKKSNVSRGIVQLHAHARHCFVNPR